MTKTELYDFLKLHPNGNVQEINFKKKYPEHYESICEIEFPESFSFQQKLFHYLNNDPELKLGICPVCGNRCKYRRINEGYNSHCSTKCSSKDESVQNKSKSTNILKYGFVHSSKNKDVRKKYIQTNLEKYGFDNPAKSKEIQSKMIETNLARYGKPNYSQTNDFLKYHRKRCEFDEIYFDSNWEIIVYRYFKMCGKTVEYSPDVSFEYTHNGIAHTYHPDFLIDGQVCEVKGNHFFENGKMINPYDRSLDDLYESKHQCMISKNVVIFMEENIKMMKTKLEIFEHLQNIEDKSGGFKKPESIKKNYPEVYAELEDTEFPEGYTFVQKLWHFLQDDFTVHTCKCGQPLKFIDFKHGYRKYCSTTCPELANHNDSSIKKAQKKSMDKQSRKLAVETQKANNGGVFWTDEQKQNLRDAYDKNKESRCEKTRQTFLKNIETMKSMAKVDSIKGNISKTELDFFLYLVGFFDEDDVDVQHYNKDEYPFACDFYIKSINLYIDINGHWTHGGHPFDTESATDNDVVDEWKSKQNEYYNNAIYTWTDLDVRKRRISKENNINRLEIFSHDVCDCIDIFESYLKEMIVDWCLSNPFPGNNKWVSNHPIWDCNVDNQPSPRYAWGNKDLMIKAVDNMFRIYNGCINEHKEPNFITAHKAVIKSIVISGNKIIGSSQRLLELVLNRFTIAKIAPKVTAISAPTVKKIIIQSGVDISNGVYVPMAGFGGIVDGVRQISNEIPLECYDINPNFCKWYGWKEKDMLSEKIKTDKVVICCPPFGKKTEHWKGTPRAMSDMDFVEWYKLIKEYIDAPDYIIIGPEIDKTGTGSNKGLDSKGNKRNGLFSKTSGVMRWTDDMIF